MPKITLARCIKLAGAALAAASVALTMSGNLIVGVALAIATVVCAIRMPSRHASLGLPIAPTPLPVIGKMALNVVALRRPGDWRRVS